MFRCLVLSAVLASISVAHAADLDGQWMPDTQVVDGASMTLNGIGLRTYSVFDVPIYVAGLYLERRTNNADKILHSPNTKLLAIRFLHDVSAADARTAWRNGFEQNCRPPCYLDPSEVQRFLAAVPPMHKGDETTLVFTSDAVELSTNHQLIGHISNPRFAEMILASFIGPVPPTPQLKRQLLGSRD
jgi:hypothetical protein